MEEGLDKVLKGVPTLRGVLVETNPRLEEISKARLQEARKGIDNGGDVGNMHIHSGKLNRSTSFTIYNMHYVNFRIQV